MRRAPRGSGWWAVLTSWYVGNCSILHTQMMYTSARAIFNAYIHSHYAYCGHLHRGWGLGTPINALQMHLHLQCIQGCREGHDLDSSAQAFRSQAGFLALKPGSCPLVRFRLSKAPCISAPGFQGLFQVLMAGSSAAKMATSRSSQLDLSSF